MSTVFIYEFTCAQADFATPSLHAEGWAMLSALVDDFARLGNVPTITLIHDALGKKCGTLCTPVRDEKTDFQRLAAQADCTLVIAPEFDNLLATRADWVLQAGGRSLGSSPSAIALTADKLRLADHLHAHGIPTPATYSETIQFPALRKPRYGAGSQNIQLLLSPGDLSAPHVAGSLIQEYVPGIAASVAFLIGNGEIVPLLPALQHLSTDGHFRYLGGTVPAPAHLRQRALDLGQRAVQSVAGLHGYVGVDLVLGATRADDRVIEINPRLTTSYVGLRQLAKANLAGALLNIGQQEKITNLDWHDRAVQFAADGSITTHPLAV